MKIILVTGAAGFIGSHLCERLLEQGNRVIGIDNFITGKKENLVDCQKNDRFRLIEADASQSVASFLQGEICTQIFHLASPASPKGYQDNPISTYQVNAFGTHFLAELALNHGATLLYTSTSEVYGDPLQHPQKETYWGNVNIRGPRACYDESKRFGEMVQTVWAREKGLNIRTVRIFNTYGPRMDPEDGRIIPTFVMQALKNQPITVHGDGSQTRSFSYVDDLVEGLIAVMDHPNARSEVYNLGNPEEYTVLEMAKIVKQTVDSSSEIIFAPRPEDDPSQRKPDISKIVTQIGWSPKTSLEQGLSKTIDYFRGKFMAGQAKLPVVA